jgi:hypothetical protein
MLVLETRTASFFCALLLLLQTHTPLLLGVQQLAVDGHRLCHSLRFTFIHRLEPSCHLKRERLEIEELLNGDDNLRVLGRHRAQKLLHNTLLVDVLVTMDDKLLVQSCQTRGKILHLLAGVDANVLPIAA